MSLHNCSFCCYCCHPACIISFSCFYDCICTCVPCISCFFSVLLRFLTLLYIYIFIVIRRIFVLFCLPCFVFLALLHCLFVICNNCIANSPLSSIFRCVKALCVNLSDMVRLNMTVLASKDSRQNKICL